MLVVSRVLIVVRLLLDRVLLKCFVMVIVVFVVIGMLMFVDVVVVG